jgi:hydrogenase-4 component F
MIEAPALALLLATPLLGGAGAGPGGPPRQRTRRERGLQRGHLHGGLRAGGAGRSPSGPMLVWRHEFYIDALNVFLVALTALRGADHGHLLAPLHACGT